MVDSPSFVDLLERVRSGDQEAATLLVHQFEPELRRTVRVRLTDPRLRRFVDSADICQSVLANFFIRVRIGEFDLRQPDQLLHLLLTMARNKVLDKARRQQARKRDQRRIEGNPDVAAKYFKAAGNADGKADGAAVFVVGANADPGKAQAEVVQAQLEKLGFKGEGSDNDPRGSVSLGEIHYAKGQEDAAKLVLTYVSPTAKLVRDTALDGTAADVVVVLGTDFDHIAVPSGTSTATTPPTTAAPTTTHSGGTGSSGSVATTPTTIPAGDPAAACR